MVLGDKLERGSIFNPLIEKHYVNKFNTDFRVTVMLPLMVAKRYEYFARLFDDRDD